MKRLINLRNVLAAALVLVAIGFGNVTTASACDAPRYYWRTVTTYTTVEKPVVEWETRYDHCGHPFQGKVISYMKLQVPVTHQVKVLY